MNKTILLGRMVKDPELKKTSSGVSVTSFSLAVQRRFKDVNGEYGTDFIDCVAWRNTADFVCKFFNKGLMVGIVGSLQTRTWEDSDGKKHKVTEVVADEAYFAESKKSNQNNAAQQPITDFNNIDDELCPF